MLAQDDTAILMDGLENGRYRCTAPLCCLGVCIQPCQDGDHKRPAQQTNHLHQPASHPKKQGDMAYMLPPVCGVAVCQRLRQQQDTHQDGQTYPGKCQPGPDQLWATSGKLGQDNGRWFPQNKRNGSSV